MRAAFTTIYDATTTSQGFGSYNGVSYYMGRALQRAGLELDYLGPLHETYAPLLLVKQTLARKLIKKSYNRHREEVVCRDYSRQIDQKLAMRPYDVVISGVSVGSQPVAYLKSHLAVVIWTDSTLASAIENYPELSWRSSMHSNLRQGLANERAALERAQLVIYPSEWAARNAIREYRLDPAKVQVVPFGANLECDRTPAQIEQLIQSRPSDSIRLLFVGMDWNRKGGPVVIATGEELKRRGVNVEVHVVGCDPFAGASKPDFVTVYGRLRRNVPAESQRLTELFSSAHVLFVPSRGEAFGHVFAEASSFGVPSISTNVGGISSAVRDGVNGFTFAPATEPRVYADRIAQICSDRSAYVRLARSAFGEFSSRLNWDAGAHSVVELIQSLFARHPKPVIPAAA